VYGICNVVGSTISRETHSGTYTHAGPEIGVASTKAFTTQITVLTMIALKLAKVKGSISNEDYMRHLRELELIPSKVEEALKTDHKLKKLQRFSKGCQIFFIWGEDIIFR